MAFNPLANYTQGFDYSQKQASIRNEAEEKDKLMVMRKAAIDGDNAVQSEQQPSTQDGAVGDVQDTPTTDPNAEESVLDRGGDV